jgi:hypothetical protein
MKEQFGPDQLPAHITPAHIEGMAERVDGVWQAFEMLGKANLLDTPQVRQLLTRRNVIHSPGGNGQYPFSHNRIMLQPKSRTAPMDTEGIVIRFATKPNPNTGSAWVETGSMLVTMGFRGGNTAEYFLSDFTWQEIRNEEDLIIEDGELKGVREGQPEAYNLPNLLDNFEPTLQDNTIPPVA